MLDLDKLYSQPVYIKKWYRRWWGILLILLLLGLLLLIISAVFYFFNVRQQYIDQRQQSNLADQQIAYARLIEGPYYDAKATTSQVTIIEFSDFACPFCQASYPILKVLIAKYPDKINLIYRDLPLHEQSIALALAARCAGEQSKFWPMHDWLFDNQSDLTKLSAENLANSLIAGAKSLGLNETAFNSCISSQKYGAYIAKDYEDANQLKLSGTPTLFIKTPDKPSYTQLDGQVTDQDAIFIEKLVK